MNENNQLTRICKECNIEKDLKKEFKMLKYNGKFCYSHTCKKCKYKLEKEYYKKHPEVIQAQRRRVYGKKKNNKKFIEDRKIRNDEYRVKNREKILLKRRISNKKLHEKQRNNPIVRLRARVSNVIRTALKRNGSSKRGESFLKYLPYTMQQLKNHLEALFEPWMNWSNHSKYNFETWKDDDISTHTWNVDHIIPQSQLPYTSMSDPNFLKCWALENLRPYSAKQNIIDGARRENRLNNDNFEEDNLSAKQNILDGARRNINQTAEIESNAF